MTWLPRLRRRSRREWWAAVLVLAGLTVFVVSVYVVIVLGGGSLTGRTASPSLPLAVLATAVVALAFEPVQARLEDFASRTMHGGLASPYDVLSRFSETVVGSYAAEELPSRMARVLAKGTRAEWSQVWLVVGDRPRLAATWPPESTRERADGDLAEGEVSGRRSLRVRHGGEVLGVLIVQEGEHGPLTSVEQRLFEGLARQAGPVLRGARLRAQLELRRAELSARANELRGSRERLVDLQDAERRLLERDIHDGAQQHLVALAVNLRLAQTLAPRSPERADAILVGQEQAALDAVDTLGHLSRGIYPRLLADSGLAPALRQAVVNSPVPVQVVPYDLGRLAPTVETAAYFCCLEAVQNAAKHSGAATIRVELRDDGGSLQCVIEDDGAGYDVWTTTAGTGLTSMRDRVEAVGGTLTTRSTPDHGTRVVALLPRAGD
ncbi:GAF domain-containing sensor histidine kinase [Nocardioides sp.]|jgi:signal transduction histidine kinase|uniref:GAF domain-containing sensor histidine kinase n=1 Tax=Nocardioides sp. TaxID=35761 RepID=UPI002F3E3D6E